MLKKLAYTLVIDYILWKYIYNAKHIYNPFDLQTPVDGLYISRGFFNT